MRHRKHKGAHSELVACAWLLNQGYEVYRNVSAHGSIDVIGTKDGASYNFNVKSTALGRRGELVKTRATKEQIDLKVAFIYVLDDGSCQIDWNPVSVFDKTIGICVQCNAEFIKKTVDTRYCSNKCHTRHYRESKKKAISLKDQSPPSDAVN